LTQDYSTLIPGWHSMSPRAKFTAIARLRTKQAKRREYDRNRPKKPRIRKPRERKPPFVYPSGYYPGQELAERLRVSYTSIKRYVQTGRVREFRVGSRVAYCEYDVIVLIEEKRSVRRENGRATGKKNARCGTITS
jgi:hypothetical protein